MTWEVRQGDALECLREMEAESVQTVVTSPPYWGLRDYGTALWEGGDSECDHRQETPVQADVTSTLGVPADGGPRRIGEDNATVVGKGVYKETCGKCGARRIDSQLGLEPTPEQYVANLVEVFREVRRVLRKDGTVWCNLGDSYASGGTGGASPASTLTGGGGRYREGSKLEAMHETPMQRSTPPGLKPKDLVGIPWRVAFALQADGWWLRSDIIWSKPNPMPESVTDRPTRAHEYLFLLTKGARYFFDADAIREPHSEATIQRDKTPRGRSQNGGGSDESLAGYDYGRAELGDMQSHAAGRNRRSVWEIATAPFKDAHFAVFPPKLVEPCILAGSPPKCCGECGAPWERVVESSGSDWQERKASGETTRHGLDGAAAHGAGNFSGQSVETLGWRSTCAHGDRDVDVGGGEGNGQPNYVAPRENPTPTADVSVVLDPFCGSGTTGVVALRHDRSFIGIELNESYCELARNRIRDDAPLLNHGLEVAA